MSCCVTVHPANSFIWWGYFYYRKVVFLFREREIFDEEILERKKWKTKPALADGVWTAAQPFHSSPGTKCMSWSAFLYKMCNSYFSKPFCVSLKEVAIALLSDAVLSSALAPHSVPWSCSCGVDLAVKDDAMGVGSTVGVWLPQSSSIQHP